MCGCCLDFYAEDLDGFKGKMPKGQAPPLWSLTKNGYSKRTFVWLLRLRLLVECSGHNIFDACFCTCSQTFNVWSIFMCIWLTFMVNVGKHTIH